MHSQDQKAEAWATVDVARLIQAVYSASAIESLETSSTTSARSIKAVFEQLPNNPTKNITLFAGCAEAVDLAVDRRVMTRKVPTAGGLASFSAIAHLDSNWSRGRLVHVFYQQRPVFAFVVPVSVGGGSDAQTTLDTITLPTLTDEVDFDEDAYEADSAGAGAAVEDVRKRSKKH